MKSLPCKCEGEGEFETQNPCEKPGVGRALVIPVLERQRGALLDSSHAYSSKF